jgi:uncharacterized oxidoreductase
LAVFDVAAFRPIEDFKREVTEFAQYLKDTPRASGFDEVYYPGELEAKRTAQLEVDGIAVEDATWDRLKELADDYGVTDRLKLE